EPSLTSTVAPAPTAAAVRVGAVLEAGRKGRLAVLDGPRCALDEIGAAGQDLVNERRRFGGLVLAEHAPAGGTRKHEPALRTRDADVEVPPLLLELQRVFPRAGVRQQPVLEPGDEDERELQALRGVHR